MIKIEVKKKDSIITGIVVTGHSGYSDSGSDIVCASVSSICITTVNALVRFDNECVDYEESDGYLKVDLKKHTKEADILVNNMIDLLSELANDYKNYIKIK